MGCSGSDVMIWDPFERFLWGIALTVALMCGTYFIHISRKREVFNERIIMLGLASLLLGFAFSLLFIYFQVLQVKGDFSNLIFCGDYDDIIKPSYEVLGKLSYISFGIGCMFFVLAFEIIIKRTKYILTITFIIIIIIEIIAFDYEVARKVFNFLLIPMILTSVPLILFLYTKGSHLEFKAVSSFLLFGFLLFMISLNLAKRAHKNLDVFPLFWSPLIFILGCCITLLPIIIDPKVLSEALKYWVLFAILALPLNIIILVTDIHEELKPIFILEFIGAFVYVYILFFLVINNIRSEMISISQDMKKDEEDHKADFLAMFTRPQQVGFLASIGHELRTPLTSIIGFAKTLSKERAGALNEEQKNQLNIILNSANHLHQLINDIIDIAKIESNKLEIRNERYDLVEELVNLKETFYITAEKKGLKFLLNTPDTLMITNDKHRINQILINLIGNAIKFTDEGRIIIKIQTLNEKVVVSVKDTGPGIKVEDLQKLFKPFGRIIEPGKIKEGSGIGLHLSKKLANSIGGNILVKSKLGKGSTFKLVLKRKEEEISY